MFSKSRIKLIRSLEKKKYRNEHGLFVVEGPKNVADMILSFHCTYIAATNEWVIQNGNILQDVDEFDIINAEDLRKVSFQEHPQKVIALFEIPSRDFKLSILEKSLCLALDNVQNPGNLGTIIRIADWFGISDIICSLNTADAYNPKTVQAAMGSLARVNVHYLDLKQMLSEMDKEIPVYGTFLNGDNIYETPLSHNGVIIMGNEGNGISADVEPFISHRITIPNFNSATTKADSLNVAVATAITCSEFRRHP